MPEQTPLSVEPPDPEQQISAHSLSLQHAPTGAQHSPSRQLVLRPLHSGTHTFGSGVVVVVQNPGSEHTPAQQMPSEGSLHGVVSGTGTSHAPLSPQRL